MSESTELQIKKSITKEGIVDFLEENSKDVNFELNNDHKIKLCSSSNFSETNARILDKHLKTKSVKIIGQVGGFFETASLLGQMAQSDNNPRMLFFDKETNNIQNAMFDSLLISISKSKEDFLLKLFSFRKTDILKAFAPKEYLKLLNGLTEEIKKMNFRTEAEFEKYIEEKYISQSFIDDIINNKFGYSKLKKYVLEEMKYDLDKHYQILCGEISGLDSKTQEFFKLLTKNICQYLSIKDNFKSFVEYLDNDISRNSGNHILNSDSIFEGYKKVFLKRAVKFLNNIDISEEKGVEDLIIVLKKYGMISENKRFSIDLAIIPHIEKMQSAYAFLKENVQDCESILKTEKGKETLLFEPSMMLQQKDYKSIGASFIEEERNNTIELTNLSETEQEKGIPKVYFMTAKYGNIYNSEPDIDHQIDMILSDKVKTVYIQGLTYASYLHNGTKRRMLIDHQYPTLDSRLKKGHESIIKRLTDNNINVVLQMGDEEEILAEDLYKIYTREQKEIGNNFLARNDLKSKYDWVRPLIKQDLIPYMIRIGEDVTHIESSDETMSLNVTNLCNAIKAYKEGLPLGDLSKYINPKYLKDSKNFRVVHQTYDIYDKKDISRAVNLIANPNYSPETQYGNPEIGVEDEVRSLQTGASGNKDKIDELPQLTVDSRQGLMRINMMIDHMAINVPQSTKDIWYKRQDFLPGIKKIVSDPVHKRVTQPSIKPNYPGGWEITGDTRWITQIIPYWSRSREIMEYVQKTGIGLPEIVALHVNDTQIGSPTERLDYFVKALDIGFYKYNIRGIFGNGDFQQGWNYNGFSNESRFLGTMSVTQQMETFIKLQEPYIMNAYGIVKTEKFIFEDQKNSLRCDEQTAAKIMQHLILNDFIEAHCFPINTPYMKNYAIKKDIDYKKINFNLPKELEVYENKIRDVLTSTFRLWFYHLIEGNHEQNTDWNDKGYNLITQFHQQLNDYKKFTGSDIEIQYNEFFYNQNGDLVKNSQGFKEINGYKTAFRHSYKAAGKGGGGGALTKSMANHVKAMGTLSHNVDCYFMSHYHHFETAIQDNKMFTVTGGYAGQSGYEDEKGYFSQPIAILTKYLSDGRTVIITIGREFLEKWQIQNPYIKEKGLDNFISECTAQNVITIGNIEPKSKQKIYHRESNPVGINARIGPKID